MTIKNWKSPGGMNPLLSAIREETNDLRTMRDVTLTLSSYEQSKKNVDTKFCECLPTCLNKPTELWEIRKENTHVVYVGERQKNGFLRVRWLQVTDYSRKKFEEYTFPQRECNITLVVD